MRSTITSTLIVAGFLLAASPWLVGGDRTIDTEHSSLKIHVGKAELFSAAGHDQAMPVAAGVGRRAHAVEQQRKFAILLGNIKAVLARINVDVECSAPLKFTEKRAKPILVLVVDRDGFLGCTYLWLLLKSALKNKNAAHQTRAAS